MTLSLEKQVCTSKLDTLKKKGKPTDCYGDDKIKKRSKR